MKLIGVDIGGTFTDLILADTAQQQIWIHKVPTTVHDPSLGMVDGIQAICQMAGITPEHIDHFLHGTTVATNALLTHEGARVGMITTQGYRDIVHIGRHQRPQHYSIMQDIPWQTYPLVMRRDRHVVTERLGPKGEVLTELNEAEAREAIEALKEKGVEAIAICFLNSYINDSHEAKVAAMVKEIYPEAFVTTSASIFPQFREFERFTTALINAFVGPKVKSYVDHLWQRLKELAGDLELHIMRSNGGVATAEVAAQEPVTLLLSGLAAGVLGGAATGNLSGRQKLITFDMGGTSTDIGIVTEDGFVEGTARDTWIAGYPVMVPMIDVHTIGAGGGSIAYVDAGGAFRVGPKSAGAAPGPACYGKGGLQAAVTDANVVLNRIDPAHFLGGEMDIYPDNAFQVMQDLADSLGLDIYEAAAGVITIVNNNMANAIRSRTIQKGHDPRQFALVALGGAGPLHAVEVAQSMGIPEVIVPRYPGITSAMGLLTTDLKYDLIQNEFLLSSEPNLGKFNHDLRLLEEQVREQLRSDGFNDDEITLERLADCRYVGQGYELRVSVPMGEIDEEKLGQVWQQFHDRHTVEYGHAFPQNTVELVTLRITGKGPMPKLSELPTPGTGELEQAWLKTTETYFRVNGQLEKYSTNFFERDRLPVNAQIEGPAVIFQKDSTTLLPPHTWAIVQANGNLLIHLEPQPVEEKRMVMEAVL
ncbi:MULTISPECIES: hydantoinase/oxoprolinase family protein [unclassified Leptolyngbya]|uniref:hydantoinase/oxoprolinase family protein n=1 Tax=unclassified Leptolyngbya TaxID=2650499 RepID=UPI001683C5D8|nr:MULTISPECIES: hydantoinase/oxoprolinase family protein [unclassified Leptolyngbya]MBD1911909.1 hydantoinase/oxoprolinase family protein [Leptolyngbya sp. FACHB-8]MBD2156118.1 hydantoinase/oxoprolinase family protein [Leptolyngbya sp. FACHB-16]